MKRTDKTSIMDEAQPSEQAEAELCDGETGVDEPGREALELWADLLRVTELLHARVTEDLLAGQSLTPEEVELLVQLSRAPEARLRMLEVSRSLLLSKSGVTRLVDRLEERGLVTRAACPEDRRVVYATLTEPGRDVLDEARPLLAAAVAEHLGRHLSSARIATVRRALRAVLAAEAAGDAR
jgi:DNA-binding MarR family transcriptional regulator